MAEVWILIRDDGSSMEAMEEVESVWSNEEAAEKRSEQLYKSERPPFMTRFERWTVRDA
jgi:hypothetical protein